MALDSAHDAVDIVTALPAAHCCECERNKIKDDVVIAAAQSFEQFPVGSDARAAADALLAAAFDRERRRIESESAPKLPDFKL